MLSQHEHLYTGAFGGLIKGTTMAGLRSSTLNVVDLKSVSKHPKLPRTAISVDDLTELGRTTRVRATLEGERRWCGNTGEELSGADVILCDRELKASLLDLRTIRVPHLDEVQQKKALRLLEADYIRFAQQSAKYEQEGVTAREKKAEAEAAAALAEVQAQRGELSSAPAPAPPEVKPFVTSGASYTSSNPWAEGEAEAANEDVEDPVVVISEAGYQSEFKKMWRNWSNLLVDWAEHYPNLKRPDGSQSEHDLVHDLMPLDMGVLYKKIIASDPGRKVYGHLPNMAACSGGQIGALNAESFCERVISCANLVVTDGNTLLGDEEVSMLVVLRMNREFMEYMRANYNAASRQRFTTTVVDD
jgi:hypothetical protein